MENKMGTVMEEITLVNAGDNVRVEAGVLKEARQLTVKVVVDTGASTIVISEEIRQKLGLKIEDTQPINFANGAREMCSLTEPVRIRWRDRFAFCSAVVIPGAKRILLGAIPLEAMDLIVHPKTQELAYAHGESWEGMAL
jgi:clan AA aspartic protease